MTQKWIDEQEDYKVGDKAFLICFYNENTAAERRTMRNNPARTNQTVSQALKGGRLNTSRGTMTVEATVVDGPHAGASVLQQGGVVFARYDPAEQHPDGRYLWDD